MGEDGTAHSVLKLSFPDGIKGVPRSWPKCNAMRAYTLDELNEAKTSRTLLLFGGGKVATLFCSAPPRRTAAALQPRAPRGGGGSGRRRGQRAHDATRLMRPAAGRLRDYKPNVCTVLRSSLAAGEGGAKEG